MTIQNEEERLKKLYWTNLAGMGQSGVLMEGYRPKRGKDCLNVTKKCLRIILV